jgi:predicted DNA-binding transcriptional regulator AlpA
MKEHRMRYLNEREVSELTGIAVQTLRNQRSSKNPNMIPYIRIGRKLIRYDLRDVHQYMDVHKVRAEDVNLETDKSEGRK